MRLEAPSPSVDTLPRSALSVRLTFAEDRFRDDLGRQQHQYGQPVEHVVHGGCGERAPEFASVGAVEHRHDRVRHRRADVRAHHNEHRLRHVQHCNGQTITLVVVLQAKIASSTIVLDISFLVLISPKPVCKWKPRRYSNNSPGS